MTIVTKQAIFNMRQAKRREYEARLRSGEVYPTMIPTLIKGFDDGMTSLLHGLVDAGHLTWSPEPTPIKPGEVQ